MRDTGAKGTRLGDLTIDRIVEFEAPFMEAFAMLPGLTPEIFETHADWLRAGRTGPAVQAGRVGRGLPPGGKGG